jgi:hypothetical protein
MKYQNNGNERHAPVNSLSAPQRTRQNGLSPLPGEARATGPSASPIRVTETSRPSIGGGISSSARPLIKKGPAAYRGHRGLDHQMALALALRRRMGGGKT